MAWSSGYGLAGGRKEHSAGIEGSEPCRTGQQRAARRKRARTATWRACVRAEGEKRAELTFKVRKGYTS